MDSRTSDLVTFSKLLSTDALLFEATERLSQLGLHDVGEAIHCAREVIATRLAQLQGRVYALCEAKYQRSVSS